MRLLSAILTGLLIMIWSVFAIAAVAQAAAAGPTWFEHVDLMQVLIAGLLALVVAGGKRTLSKIDANQTNLFQKYENHEKRLSHLEGAHESRTGMKLNCTVEKEG